MAKGRWQKEGRGRGGRGCRGRARDGAADDGVTEREEIPICHVANPKWAGPGELRPVRRVDFLMQRASHRAGYGRAWVLAGLQLQPPRLYCC